MTILLTNDDGFESEGIQTLHAILSKDHDVWMFAPDRDRSGVSQSLTFLQPLLVQSRGSKIFSCSGTPTDCVILALKGEGIPVIPDLLLSGINRGANLGDDTLYSGTMAAAREGALSGMRSVALSLSCKEGISSFKEPALFVKRNIAHLHAMGGGGEHFLNINFPSESKEPYAVAVTTLAQNLYESNVTRHTSMEESDAKEYIIGRERRPLEDRHEGTDIFALREGKISLSVVTLFPTTIPLNKDIPLMV